MAALSFSKLRTHLMAQDSSNLELGCLLFYRFSLLYVQRWCHPWTLLPLHFKIQVPWPFLFLISVTIVRFETLIRTQALMFKLPLSTTTAVILLLAAMMDHDHGALIA